MTRRFALAVAGVLLYAGLTPVTVVAQTPPAQTPAAPTAASNGLQIAQLEEGFVIAPDARFTKINDRTATLAGAYAGWMVDRTLLIGAAGYWLANRGDDFKVQYGGAIIRWAIGGHRAVAISPGLFLGVGDATLSRPYGEIFGDPRTPLPVSSRGRDTRNGIRFGQTFPSADTPVRVSDTYYVAEPQVTAVWRLTPWMRLDAGVTYRFIGDADLLDKQLRGPAGTLAIQFGGR
jgi:hypothetical protein